MRVYTYREDGVYTGYLDIEDSPVIPHLTTIEAPPEIPAGHYAVMSGTWNIIQGDVPQYPTASMKAREWDIVRISRNTKLQESDWTQVNDAPVDQPAWAVYRQALRDITEQSDPFNIVWPTPPQ